MPCGQFFPEIELIIIVFVVEMMGKFLMFHVLLVLRSQVLIMLNSYILVIRPQLRITPLRLGLVTEFVVLWLFNPLRDETAVRFPEGFQAG